MADEPNPNVPPQDPPPAPPPETIEAVDERGVPYKNVAAEMQRKLQEVEQQKQALLDAIQASRQPVPADPPKTGIQEILKQYKPEDQAALMGLFNEAVAEAERRARTVGYTMMTEVGVQTELQKDPEVLKEAQAAYQRLKAHPAFSGSSDLQLQYTALQEAKAAVAARRPAGGGLPPPVNLPGNRGGGAPPPSGDPKEKFVKDWMADSENRAVFQSMYRGKFTLESEAGQKALKEAAEIAYSESQKQIPYFGSNSVVGKAALSILNQAKGAQ